MGPEQLIGPSTSKRQLCGGDQAPHALTSKPDYQTRQASSFAELPLSRRRNVSRTSKKDSMPSFRAVTKKPRRSAQEAPRRI